MGSLRHREYSVAEDAQDISEYLQTRLRQPVTIAEVVSQTGIPFEDAEEAMNYLAVRNNATVTWLGDHNAYIFKQAHASIAGEMPSLFRSFGRYATDTFASQIAYIMQALVAVGPTFVASALFLRADSPIEWVAAGTLSLASGYFIFSSILRSMTLMLPLALVAGFAYYWDTLVTGDVFWIPIVILAALGIQAKTVMKFRSMRPNDSLRLIFWGRGFTQTTSDEKRLMELISAKRGRVTIGDLMRTFGWSVEECNEALADLLIEYGGDIAVDSAGTIHLQFPELADRGVEHQMPKPAYELERDPPGPFEGLNLGWVGLITIMCAVGLFISPLNPAYVEFVKGVDFTLSGIGMFVRQAAALLFTIPLGVYLVRMINNIRELGHHEERREFLDALEYADKNAKGSLIGVDWYDEEILTDLNAQIHPEKSEPGTLYVSFPDLAPSLPDATMDEIFFDFDENGLVQNKQVFEHNQEVRSWKS